MNSCFSVVILSCIFINTITLSLDKYPIDFDYYNNLEKINNVCTLIFLVEMIIKLLGLGMRSYILDI